MGLHRVKSTGGDILKTQVLLDIFVKKLYCPAQTIPQYDLALRDSDITTGEVLAATLRSFFKFRTHQLHVTHIAQVAQGVSNAKFHSLRLGAIRHETNGLPLQPAMIAKEQGNRTPLS